MTLALWAELMSDSEVSACLPALSKLGLGLGLMLPAERLGDRAFARVTRQAADLGVPIRLWPLLSRQRGYWMGKTNAAEAAALIDRLVAWRQERHGPAFAGVSVDLEPSFEYSEALRKAGNTRPDRLLRLLLARVNPPEHRAAREHLGGAVDRLRSVRLVAHAVTYPLVLDQTEGSTLLEDALDIVVSGIEWDEVSFMVYQTPFAQLLGSWLGPALVHSYAQSAVAHFGARAGLDLGIVGDAGVGVDPGARYPSPSALFEDLAAARAAGVPAERTRIYGLAGVLQCGGVERWLSLARTEPGEPNERWRAQPERRMVAGWRNAVRALELALRVASTR